MWAESESLGRVGVMEELLSIFMINSLVYRTKWSDHEHFNLIHQGLAPRPGEVEGAGSRDAVGRSHLPCVRQAPATLTFTRPGPRRCPASAGKDT